MKLNIISKSLIALGMGACAVNAFALEAWSGQEGGTTYEVIFDGDVYTNAWWVGASNCPKDASNDQANNPWRYQRDATAAEIAQYGNPTSCDINGGETPTYENFSVEKSYAEGTIVIWQDATWQAKGAMGAYSFTPGAGSPWQLYKATETWNASKTYNKGDVVTMNGQSYEALFYTIGDNPSVAGNQNPNGNNGRPWKPLGATKTYSEQELKKAPQFNAKTRYSAGQLVQFQGQPYVSQNTVQAVSPTDANLWANYNDWSGTKERVGTAKSPWPAHVYAPYVDFTLNSIPDLATLAREQNINHFTLAFVVAKNADTCQPTWGTAYNMHDYAQYSKIKALREAGGDVMVSIGGANNAPLAAACKNPDDLQKLYYDIVDNLNLNVLDFDIEGTWVADHDSIQRRNEAVKAVQDQWKAEKRTVALWYTLPILPTGLTAEGLYVLEDARAKGVELSGVNVMTMDYGNSICQSDNTEGQNIHGQCATSAIDNLFKQLKAIWPEKSDAQINAMMGTTPMIGYNDVQGEVFYLSDADMVMKQAQERNMGMIGIWSMARDQPGIAKQVSPEHSGMTPAQAPQYAYSKVFAPFTNNVVYPEGINYFGIEVVKNKPEVDLVMQKEVAAGKNDFRIYQNGTYIGEYYNGKAYYGVHKADPVTGAVTARYGIPMVAGDVIELYKTNVKPSYQGKNTLLYSLTVTQDMLDKR